MDVHNIPGMASDIGNAYAARNRPMSSWPLAGAMLITVLSALFVWNMTTNPILTVVPTILVGGALTVRYGPSPSRIFAYAVSLGVLTGAILAGWALLFALLQGVVATPASILRPVIPACIGIAVGIPLVAGSIQQLLAQRQSEGSTNLRRDLPVRAILIVAGVLAAVLLVGAAAFVYNPAPVTPESSEPPSTSAGTEGAMYASAGVTTEQVDDGTWNVDVYVYQFNNADYVTVAAGQETKEITDVGQTVQFTGLEQGTEVTVTVTGQGTTKTIRTVTLGESGS